MNAKFSDTIGTALRSFSILGAFVLVTALASAENTPSPTQSLTARTWESGYAYTCTKGSRSMPYRFYIPQNYNAATKYPLVIFLHGAGECGTDNMAQVKAHVGGLIARTYSDYPAFLIAPQLNSGGWSPYNANDLTLTIIAAVRSRYSIDERRIYITGLSLGGFGTTAYAAAYPRVFAAIAPMSGANTYPTVTQLSQIPTWLFHGSADSIVSVDSSRRYYTTVTGLPQITFDQTIYGYPTAVSGPIRYTQFTGWNHVIWDPIYANAATDFYDWMFSQTRPPGTCTFTCAPQKNGDLIFSSSNNVPFGANYLMTATDLQTPPAQWQCIATNWCDANGVTTFTNKLNSNASHQFYMLKLP